MTKLTPEQVQQYTDDGYIVLKAMLSPQQVTLLSRTAREEGSTVILVTHEPRVAAYADREVIVRDGKVTSAAGILP